MDPTSSRVPTPLLLLHPPLYCASCRRDTAVEFHGCEEGGGGRRKRKGDIGCPPPSSPRYDDRVFPHGNTCTKEKENKFALDPAEYIYGDPITAILLFNYTRTV